MSEVSATEASRNFADLLDAVEHGDETFTIVRRGRVIAQLGAPPRANGAALKAVLRAHRPDPAWIDDLRSVWDLLEPDDVTGTGDEDGR
ncbi:MAG: type II toxin-antitoxin system Phd/YefM family antitoxin [Actinobacteria bacterium]|jgi:antitoxin (DNA-binding transcriptional repressor) of toxin-antitoxin stability system|nr:type II toxin-antitoxin system Phd/YefM family antitoxin [Actinomycetota bacterium]MDP7551105.1 type II toxin-antitoxin system Phd/YefM family antitoxin [Acidimicrobiales bacterium]MBT3687008.1 type II toxin-antitoxin system Phd/YefM family antitoxin [Actinomycetota bacterium]MBT4037437.1 type II toxin-antitoxin system Phd/YefM family antitoxin [Actinomycetota bacterium]MBT4279737.1 type II toxin-antitoxin system Phd/YefM family antitoxin [Actinomycetota bacterium]|tara:strand:+ start:541 stop:807 length:267 start_codon:yes stop_codon:yes gene_type:complete